MKEGKEYKSSYKGVEYQVRVSAVEEPTKGFSATVYSNFKEIGMLKEPTFSVDEALKQSSLIIKNHHENPPVSNADGGTPSKDVSVKEGTIKLTWLDDKDNGILHSQMFSNVDEALNAASATKKNWLIMKSIKSNNGEYTWELMPYGNYKKYKRGMFVSDSFVIKAGISVLALTGVFFIVKTIVKAVKK